MRTLWPLLTKNIQHQNCKKNKQGSKSMNNYAMKNKPCMYRLIVSILFHIFAMSAIKWHVRFVDCSLIYADFQILFVFKTFEFGANFCPRWFSFGFEFETVHGKICKKMNNPTKNQLSYFGWVGEIMSWSENY